MDPTTQEQQNSHAKRLDTCWKEVGVWGDNSCAQLKSVSHCRNCQVFSSTAAQLLDIDVPADYLDEWTRHYSAANREADPTAIGVVLFRLGTEWFGLKSNILQEITEFKTIHTLPHGPEVVMGLINIRGILLIAIQLGKLLGMDTVTFSGSRKHGPSPGQGNDLKPERILVVAHHCKPIAFPVNEVGGIHQFGLHHFKVPPVTVSNTSSAFTSKVFSWRDQVVGLLDEELLFYTILKKFS